MSAKFKPLSSSVVVIVLAVVLVSYSSSAIAQTGGVPETSPSRASLKSSLNAVPGGPDMVSIAGATFVPTNSTSEKDLFLFELYNPSSTAAGTYIAPVSLRHGAEITKLIVYTYDGVPGNVSVSLYCIDVDGLLTQTIATAESSGEPEYNYSIDDSIDNASVDNQKCSYFAVATIPATYSRDLTLVSIRVDYSFAIYAPAILR